MDASATADLGQYVKRFNRASVLVVGDAMLDRYVYGNVNRVSPEAPVPILTVTREAAMPGGAGNVVRNLIALDASAAFVSVVGDDQAGSDLTGLVGGQERVEPWLLVHSGRITTLKTRYIAQGQHMLRADREETIDLPAKLAERLIRIALDAMAATSITVLSDYRKGVLSEAVCAALITGAKKLGRKIIVDPKGRDWSRYRGADIVTPNRRELHEATGLSVDSETGVVAAAQVLIDRYEFGAVLVTRAEDGMSLITREEIRHYPAEAREVFDVSGAGDTVVAALAAALATEVPLAEAARLANIAAGIVVGKVGTAVARPADLLAAIAPATGALQKVVTPAAAAEAAERWRLRGYKVGFTNGCFDLLHPGHVHLLEQCRSLCDRLIVGINADASVKRLKGPTRPAQGEAARAAVLASLASIDLVCLFEEDTPIELIKQIKPDLLIKGADYTRETVVGADLVESWGGAVALAQLLPGHSTTATLARLRGSTRPPAVIRAKAGIFSAADSMTGSLPLGPEIDPWPRPLPVRQNFAGTHVTLEPLHRRHTAELRDSMRNAESSFTYMPYGPFDGRAALESFIASSSTDPLTAFWSIRPNATGVASGWLSLMNIEPKNAAIELGSIWLSPALQRTRAATEAMFLALRHAADELGYRRLVWKCDALNAASRRAAERLGFTPEGILRAHMVIKSRTRDTAMYSIIDSEWPTRRNAILAWLAPENFAPGGTARRSLASFRA